MEIHLPMKLTIELFVVIIIMISSRGFGTFCLTYDILLMITHKRNVT